MDKYCEDLIAKTVSRSLLQKKEAENDRAKEFVENIIKIREEEIQSWIQLTGGKPCYQRTFLIHPVTEKCYLELITKIKSGKKASYLAKSEAKKYGCEVVPVADAGLTLHFVKSSKVHTLLNHLVLCGCVLQAENLTEELL